MHFYTNDHFLIPCVTVQKMWEIDRLMMDKYRIQLIQMMENAGLALAKLCWSEMLEKDEKHVVVIAGHGNNGGGGLVATRRLACWGAKVTVVQPIGQLKEIPAVQLQSIKEMDIRFITYADNVQLNDIQTLLDKADLIIDALIGYGLTGNPTGLYQDLIEAANRSITNVFSLDIPSGLHADTGEPMGICIKAKATLTIALPKTGFLFDSSQPFLGKCFVADISVPNILYQRLGIDVRPFFNGEPYIELNRLENKNHN